MANAAIIQTSQIISYLAGVLALMPERLLPFGAHIAIWLGIIIKLGHLFGRIIA